MKQKLFIAVVFILVFCGISFAQKNSEYTVRANLMLLDCSVNATAGVFTNDDVVLGIGSGWGQVFRTQAEGASIVGQRLTFYAYHRLYIPLGTRRNVFVYSDLMLGGMWVYKNAEDNKSLRWYYSWQPGVAFRTRGESNVFLGISLGPTFGLHAGLAF